MPYKKIKNKRVIFIAQVRRGNMKREKVFQNKKEALAWEAEMRKLPDEEWIGETIDTICLLDWAESYLDHAKGMFSEKTFKEKKSMFKRFFKHIDPQMPVAKLTPSKVLAYVQEQNKMRSGYAANKDRKNLVAAWNWGMKYLGPAPLPSPNPCLVIKMPEKRKPRYIPPAEDFWKVYNVAKDQDRVMLLTFLHLAARRGEVFKLQIQDLDFENNRVRLWTKKRENGNYESDWLPMTQKLREGLLWWLKNRPIQDSSYVFICLDETPFCKEYYGKPFKLRSHLMSNLCTTAGVKPFGFHAIRHLTATILFQQGYSVATIQAILRHQNPNTTTRYLKSLGVEDVRAALDGLAMPIGSSEGYIQEELSVH